MGEQHFFNVDIARKWLSGLVILFGAVGYALSAGVALAGPEFPRVAIISTVTDPPAKIRAFVEQLRAYSEAGKLAEGSADHEAKAWVLAHVSPGFTCERDFGGVCGGDAYSDRVRSFLRRAGYWEEIADITPVAGDPTAWSNVDLTPVGMDVSRLFAPLAGLGQDDGAEYCSAELQARSLDRFQAAIDTLVNDPDSGVDDELSAWFRLNGVLGTWNVRAEPDIDADKIGKVANEIVFMLGDGEIKPEMQSLPDGRVFGWHHVGLHDGREGYIAVDDQHRMTSLDEKLCVGLVDGRAMITGHVGGGD